MEGLVFLGDAFDLLDENLVLYKGLPHPVVIIYPLQKCRWFHFIDLIVGELGLFLGLEEELVDRWFFFLVEQFGELVSDIDLLVDFLFNLGETQVSLPCLLVRGRTG